MTQQIRPSNPRATEGRRFARQPQLGQVHTAEGELDLSAIYVVHHGLRRDLRDFSQAVAATPLTDLESWSALHRRWINLTTVLHHHTRTEDRWIWPEIFSRLPDGDTTARSTLGDMAVEHQLLEPLLKAVRLGFDKITAHPATSVQHQLNADLRSASDAVLDHLAREETDALPLMQRHLPADRWKVAQTGAAKEYGLADLRFAVPWSAWEIPADQFPVAFAHGGILVRVLLALTRRRFARDHRIAFRYLVRAA